VLVNNDYYTINRREMPVCIITPHAASAVFVRSAACIMHAAVKSIDGGKYFITLSPPVTRLTFTSRRQEYFISSQPYSVPELLTSAAL